MKKAKLFIILALWAVASSFTDGVHFITDDNTRSEVTRDFYNRMKGIGTEKGGRFANMAADPSLRDGEREAYMFIVAYAPLCDLGDCEPEYFVRQVRGAMRAREYFSWGQTVPEDIFRHFVLPHRVNNENLDEARDVFFEELKVRISGMSMYEAALEVNHWCHEKVEYRATDARTSAPLALVKTSWGRCGEESAFTATALRAVGIPARQVYTPRWVHTDSNHAWVEVWIDGKWHYLGACEPEPDLDMAWFTAPATRAMMMHTTVFGKYRGPEEVSVQTDLYTTINLLENYAPTRRIEITVQSENGLPTPGATVKYKVYNYGEFYPIATATSDKYGRSSLTTGYGDIFIWASMDDQCGYFRLVADNNSADVIMTTWKGEFRDDFVMNAPSQQPVTVPQSAKIAENRRRLAQEDSIRNAYMSTFPADDIDYARRVSYGTGIDEEKTLYYLRESQGNWKEISDLFFRKRNDRFFAGFMESLTAKDLRDTPQEYLYEHLMYNPRLYDFPDEIMASKVLSPRIDMEIITPWRLYLWDNVINDYGSSITPEDIIGHVKDNIRVDPVQNYVACLITPMGVHKLKVADARSRNVYFVALCRTAGIPAHIDKATGKPQFYKDGLWHDALFDDDGNTATVQPMGSIEITSSASNRIVPAYRSHYTLARFADGDFATLDLAGELSGREYPTEISVPAGYYRLTVGSRANDGSASVHTEYFDLAENGSRHVEIAMPETEGKLFVEGILDMNTTVFLADGTKTTLKEQSNDKGLILVFTDPAGEPTRHILQEMPAYREQLEEWGGGILFVEPEAVAGATFNRSLFSGIPSQAIWMPDGANALLNAAVESLRIDFSNEFPLTLYLNTSGGILFSNKGYRLGVVESLYRTISSEQEMTGNKCD